MGAIEKINTEMQKRPDDLYMEILGHYLIDRASLSDKDEAAIGGDGRSLAGAMGAVRNEAHRHKSGAVAVLLPDQVVKVVDTYFGLDPDPRAWIKALEGAHGGRGGYNPETPVKAGISLALEDFL